MQNNEQAKRQKPQKKQDAAPSLKEERLELLFLIINRNKTEYYIDLLQSFDINMELIAMAHGTATANMLALLHLNDSDKALIMGVIQASKIEETFSVLEEKFKTIRNGQGIAYTVPLTGIIGTLIFGFLSNNRMTVKDDKENTK